MPIVWKEEVGEHGLNALDEEQEPYYFRWGAETVLIGATQQSARQIMAALSKAQAAEVHPQGVGGYRTGRL